ncbi:ThiF family adenylyltransferase [Bhargavaea cecembensis]|uniref:ThiF family adenylyltransferase n=1 Tax=Bhargavaea cecembensis TaxID=394098 RepID=UPI00058F2885|nr:ThiF family adenylyltransferase [Bhargavaea cecembensis]
MDGRYSRQTLFSPVGEEGQREIGEATVAVIGCGALGSAISETLVRAGIGELLLVDRDYVELSNLQRQQLFTEEDARQMLPKVVAAERRLREIRRDVNISTWIRNADGPLMEELARRSAVIMDATDNFETRLLINDAAAKHGIPWIHGACVGSSGTVFPFVPGRSACFRCLLPVLPAVNATCDTAGIIPPAVSVTAALQCAEAMKWLTGNRDSVRRKVHHFDLWSNEQLDIGVSRIQNPECETCGSSPVYPELAPRAAGSTAVLCGRDAVQILPDPARPITLDAGEAIGRRLGGKTRRTPYFVEFRAFGRRLVLFGDGRLLIHGAKTSDEGRTLYHRLFG